MLAKLIDIFMGVSSVFRRWLPSFLLDIGRIFFCIHILRLAYHLLKYCDLGNCWPYITDKVIYFAARLKKTLCSKIATVRKGFRSRVRLFRRGKYVPYRLISLAYVGDMLMTWQLHNFEM